MCSLSTPGIQQRMWDMPRHKGEGRLSGLGQQECRGKVVGLPQVGAAEPAPGDGKPRPYKLCPDHIQGREIDFQRSGLKRLEESFDDGGIKIRPRTFRDNVFGAQR